MLNLGTIWKILGSVLNSIYALLLFLLLLPFTIFSNSSDSLTIVIGGDTLTRGIPSTHPELLRVTNGIISAYNKRFKTMSESEKALDSIVVEGKLKIKELTVSLYDLKDSLILISAKLDSVVVLNESMKREVLEEADSIEAEFSRNRKFNFDVGASVYGHSNFITDSSGIHGLGVGLLFEAGPYYGTFSRDLNVNGSNSIGIGVKFRELFRTLFNN